MFHVQGHLKESSNPKSQPCLSGLMGHLCDQCLEQPLPDGINIPCVLKITVALGFKPKLITDAHYGIFFIICHRGNLFLTELCISFGYEIRKSYIEAAV